MGATLYTHTSFLLFPSYSLTHLCFPKGTNKDSSLYSSLYMVSFTKSNLSLEKKHFLVFNRKQPE